MHTRVIILIVSLALWPTAPVRTACASTPVIDREYRIKAAFLYNFLRTVDWPASQMPGPDAAFRVGIIGVDPFGSQLDPITAKRVKNRPIAVTHYPSLVSDTPEHVTADRLAALTDALVTCHVLFVCRSETTVIPALLEALQTRAVLTVGESHEFLEQGGAINFIPTAPKGDFEINLTHCERVGLKPSSKLLRIAKRVIHK